MSVFQMFFRHHYLALFHLLYYLCNQLTIDDDTLINSVNMKKHVLTAFYCLFLLMGNAQAQDEHLKMQFDFSNTSGTNVKDATSGITAKLMGQAQVVTMGQYHVLDLGNGTGYLDMTRSAGELVRSLGASWMRSDFVPSRSSSRRTWRFSSSSPCSSV